MMRLFLLLSMLSFIGESALNFSLQFDQFYLHRCVDMCIEGCRWIAEKQGNYKVSVEYLKPQR